MQKIKNQTYRSFFLFSFKPNRSTNWIRIYWQLRNTGDLLFGKQSNLTFPTSFFVRSSGLDLNWTKLNKKMDIIFMANNWLFEKTYANFLSSVIFCGHLKTLNSSMAICSFSYLYFNSKSSHEQRLTYSQPLEHPSNLKFLNFFHLLWIVLLSNFYSSH